MSSNSNKRPNEDRDDDDDDNQRPFKYRRDGGTDPEPTPGCSKSLNVGTGSPNQRNQTPMHTFTTSKSYSNSTVQVKQRDIKIKPGSSRPKLESHQQRHDKTAEKSHNLPMPKLKEANKPSPQSIVDKDWELQVNLTRIDLDRAANTTNPNNQNSNRVNQEEGSIKPYSCEVCGISFKRPKALACHQSLVTKCNNSGKQAKATKQSTSSSKNNQPKRSKKESKSEEVTCAHCPAVFPYNNVREKKLFEEHVESHYGEREFMCHCGRSYTTISFLLRHAAAKHDQSAYQCPNCQINCKSNIELQSHLKTCTRPAESDSDSESTT